MYDSVGFLISTHVFMSKLLNVIDLYVFICHTFLNVVDLNVFFFFGLSWQKMKHFRIKCDIIFF